MLLLSTQQESECSFLRRIRIVSCRVANETNNANRGESYFPPSESGAKTARGSLCAAKGTGTKLPGRIIHSREPLPRQRKRRRSPPQRPNKGSKSRLRRRRWSQNEWLMSSFGPRLLRGPQDVMSASQGKRGHNMGGCSISQFQLRARGEEVTKSEIFVDIINERACCDCQAHFRRTDRQTNGTLQVESK